MKKIVLSLAVLASVALVSCGGKKAETADSDTMVADTAVEMVADSAVDSAAAPAADTAATPAAADTAKAQ